MTNEEIPIECLADDFSLPDIGQGEVNHAIVSYDSDEYHDSDSYNEEYNNQNNIYDTDYEDDSSDIEPDDSFSEDGYNDLSF